MANEKPNYYAILTANVRYDKDLIPNAKLLYAEITALCNLTGECFASNNYFAKLFNVSKSSIQSWLKNLEEKGYIKREIKYKKDSFEVLKRYISIDIYPSPENCTTPSPENCTTPSPENCTTPSPENCVYNNNLFNTNNKKINKKHIITHDKFSKIYKLYNSNARVVPDIKSKSFNRTCTAVKNLGSYDLLLDTIKDYLKYVEQEKSWLKKKGFDAWMNSTEHYGQNWKCLLKDLREQEFKEEDMPL